MLELYPTKKFHLSSEIQLVEVEDTLDFKGFSSKSYSNYKGNLGGNTENPSCHQLSSPVSPSSSDFFKSNKILTCAHMSQKTQK